MRIPASSAILIKGINLVSLVYAAALSKLGTKVLLIDDKVEFSTSAEYLNIDLYSFQLLKNIGFIFDEDASAETIKSADFTQQALKFLAENLCSVIWDVNITKSVNNKNHTLLQNHQETEHHSDFFINASAFENTIVDFRIAFLQAWRFAGVVNQSLFPKILESIHVEVHLFKNQFSKNIKPPNNGFFSQLMAQFSQQKPDLNLIDSKVSLHLSQSRKLEAGELLPDYSFFDEKLKVQSSLHQWCNYHHFSVIIFGYLLPTNLFTIAKWIQLNFPVQLFYLPQSKNNEALFEKLQIRDGEKKTLIIRPDKYIGLLHDSIDLELIANYLSTFIYMREKEQVLTA